MKEAYRIFMHLIVLTQCPKQQKLFVQIAPYKGGG